MWGRLSRAGREAAADRARQRRELRHLRYLRDEVFARPDIARMYWHTRHPDDLDVLTDDRFVAIADGLRQGGTRESAREDPVTGLIRDFLDGLDAEERKHLIGALGTVFRNLDRDDLADRLERPAAGFGQEVVQ